MYLVISSVWLVTTIVSGIQGGRKLTLTLAILGLLTHYAYWNLGIGLWAIPILALLSIIAMFSAPEIFFRS